ncbi:hypothetical protein ACA910_010280 [Epithemia clementina (nom. ined.)]
MAGDWLTTKKAGRDDDQIAKDKAQAVQARKRQRKPNISASTAAKTKKTKGGGTKRSTTTNSNTKKKPRRTFLNDSDDDDDEVLSSDNSMDSFIVPEGKEHDEDEDDDEQELDDEENDSDDELSEPEFNEDDENDDDDDDDDDEENDEDDDDNNDDNSDGGFLDTLPGNSRRTRTSKPAPHLQRQRQRPPRTATLSNVAAAAVASKKGTKNPFASFVAAASKPTASARSVKPLSSVTKKPPPSAKKSRLVGRKHDNHEDDGEQSDSSVGVVVKSTQKSAFSLKDDDDNDDDDSPILRRKKRPKHVLDSLGGQTTSTSSTTPQSSSTSHHLQDLMDSSDDNNDHPQKKPTKSGSKGLAQRTKNNSTKTPKSKDDNNNNNRNDDNNNDDLKPPGVAIEDSLASLINLMEDDDDDNHNDDEDEQMAVALALSNSLAENNKANNSRDDDDDDDKHLVDLLEDTDNDDENDNNSNNGDNDDDDRDEGFANREETSKEAQQAASILATANRLSIQVLQTMRSWMNAGQDENNSNSDNNNNSDNNAPVLGMIVDGALAMTDFQANGGAGAGAGPSDTPQCHDWISQETMQRICPQITLAKYQLIGVNWMALLHSLQVDVADNTSSSHQAKTRKKKTTNVNGVLADEMGLGKTAQTITFLAWLKYQRELKEVVVEEEEGSDAGGSPTAKQVDRSGGVVNLLDDDDDSDDDDVVDLDKEHVKNNNSSSSSTSKTTGTIEKQTGKQYYLPHLVVAPSSVLSNWEREFQRFAPHLKVVKYHGTQAERRALQEELRLHLPKNWVTRQRAGCPPLDVILTPITYFQKEKSDDRAFLRKYQYHYLVVDEAHLLKNAQGLRYTTLNKMDTQNRLLLTGTPVQNSPQELMSLLCFLMPLFSSGNHNNSRRNDYDDDDDDDDDEHGKKQQEDGQGMLQHFVSLEKEGVQVDDATAYLKLKQLFAPFVLRRRKQDVLQQIMPPKERKVEFVPLDDRARAVYNKILSDHLEAKKVGAKQLDHVFTQLRKAAHHPLLLRTRHASDAERHELAQLFHQYGAFGGDGGGSCNSLAKVREAVDQMNDFDIHLMALDLMEEEDGGQNKSRREALSKYTLMEDDLFSSAKCVRLQTLLPQLVADGHRILIFSIWTSCLDLLSCLMEQLGFKYLRMQGSTPVPERQGLIDQFSNDTLISVFLLSTKACGLGINLTAADTCIMHDIDFNPFNDLQAEDRVHRIGQTKKTTVIKLVAADTVDADIYEMQQRKARMNAAIMDSDWNKEEAKSVKDEVMRTAVDRFLSQSTQLPMAPPPSECLGEDTSNPPCRSSATNEEDAAATASRSNNRNPFDMKKDPAPKESKSIVVANKKQNGKKDTKAAAAAVEGGSLVESLDSDSDTLALSKRPAAKTKEKRGSASPDREDI